MERDDGAPAPNSPDPVSDALLRSALRAAGMGCWDWNVQSDRLSWSREAERLCGLQPEQLPSTFSEYLELVVPEDRELVIARSRAALEEGTDYESEHRVLWPDGSVHWLRSRGRVHLGPDGCPGGLAATLWDVTREKESLAALTHTEQRFTELTNHMRGVFWVREGGSSQVLFVSRGYEEIWGRSREELNGNPQAWLTAVVAEDRKRVGENYLPRVQSGTYDEVYRVRHADGTLRWVWERAFPIHDQGGQVTRIVGIAEDVTEQRRTLAALEASEHSYRKLVDHAGDAIFVHDDGGRLLDVNRAACQSLGYTRSELLSLRIQDVETALSQDPQPWRDLIEGRIRPPLTLAGYFRRKDGSSFPVEIRLGFLGRRSALAQFVAIARDVTEREAVEARLREQGERLRDLATHLEDARAQERLELSRDVHDELGQTLTVLKLDLAEQQRELTDPEQRRRNERMLNSVGGALETVRRLSKRLRPEVLDLGLADAIEAQASEMSVRAGWSLRLDYRIGTLRADPARDEALFRIVQEALTNVACHAQANRVFVSLSRAGDRLRLSVRDDGRGLEPGALNSPNSLGLLGMQERAAALGGELHIKRPAGGGTEVEMLVPLQEGT